MTSAGAYADLAQRAHRGDREAAFDLVALYRPRDVTDLVAVVCGAQTPRPWLFDLLCDVYRSWTG